MGHAYHMMVLFKLFRIVTIPEEDLPATLAKFQHGKNSTVYSQRKSLLIVGSLFVFLNKVRPLISNRTFLFNILKTVLVEDLNCRLCKRNFLMSN